MASVGEGGTDGEIDEGAWGESWNKMGAFRERTQSCPCLTLRNPTPKCHLERGEECHQLSETHDTETSPVLTV